jgi:hypothetical protein
MKKSLEHIQMVFLVSRGRSGSTLLQTILDTHSKICAPLESKFVLHLKSKYENINTWDEKVINQFIKDLYTNRKIRLFWNMDKSTVLNLFNQYNINSFADACKIVYLSFPSINSLENTEIIVDKNPAHSRFVKDLHVVFPDAKFIHLIRDPRATINSQIIAFNRKSIYILAELWVYLNNKIINSIKLNKIKSCSIQYENLVNNPKKEITDLMQFLNLSFEDRMLNSYKSIKSFTKENNYLSLPHHQNIGNPINTDSLNKWKKSFSLSDIKIINSICYEMATKYNYDLSPESLSFSESLNYSFSKMKVLFINFSLKSLFNFPFWVRKMIYSVVSLFFDKKYKN